VLEDFHDINTCIRSDTLHKLHPGCSVVISESSLFDFPDVVIQPIVPENIITTSFFVPFARRLGASGVLIDLVSYGAFRVAWDVSRSYCGAVGCNLTLSFRNTILLYMRLRSGSYFPIILLCLLPAHSS
jgi:hypothetical protein